MIYINDLPLNVTKFPDNTSQCWKLPEEILSDKCIDIKWDFDSEDELMHLAQLKALLDAYSPFAIISLDIKYLPYARQDKPISNVTTFALRVFANILNSLNFDDITILDPHSATACNLIKNSRFEYPFKDFFTAYGNTKSNILCYPDKGAKNKYSSLLGAYNYIHGEKVRDQLTGNITSYKLVGDPKDKKILIVDDICDYGRTFILLAKELLSKGAKEINLFVTHGLFSGGTRILREAGIKRIFTANGEVHDRESNIQL